MTSWRVLVLAAAALLAAAPAAKAEYEVIAQTNVEYAQHDGTKLLADLYQPKGLTKAPAIIAVHGGGWQNGSRAGYRYWGPFLAKNGYVVLSIDYRLGKAGTYPGSVYDVKAAIQFVRAKAESLGVDPGSHRPDGRFRRLASGGAGGARRRRAAVLLRLSGRSQCGGAGQREGGGRLLRRLRHAGAVAPRPDRAPARPDRREISGRLADAEPAHLFRSPRRSAMPRSTRRARGSCSSTAPTTTSWIRRPSRKRSGSPSTRPASRRAGSSFRGPGISGRPIRSRASRTAIGATTAPRLLRFLGEAL